MVINTSKMVGMDDGDRGIKANAGGAIGCSEAGPEGRGNLSNTSTGHRDVPGTQNGTADATKNMNCAKATWRGQ